MLKEKVAIVTGAGQGIGRAIAHTLACHGSAVVLCDIVKENVEAVEKELREKKYTALAVLCDVSDYNACEAMVKTTLEKFGRVDILVNNAGITRDRLLMKMTEEDWDAVMAVNLKSVFNCSKAVCRTMFKQRCGCIINISSIVGLTGNIGQANYAASKAGIIGLTKTLAKEFASRNITVNAVAPGFIKTRMTEVLSDSARAELQNHIPLRRLGEPEDVANAVLFLASPSASYITGQVLQIDGGMAI